MRLNFVSVVVPPLRFAIAAALAAINLIGAPRIMFQLVLVFSSSRRIASAAMLSISHSHFIRHDGALLLTCCAANSKSQKPVKSTIPLGADEIAIYKAVLRTYSGDKDVNLNVAATTYLLDPKASTAGFDQPECLKGVELENLSSASSSYHQLPADALPSEAMRLVDQESSAPRADEHAIWDTLRSRMPGSRRAMPSQFETSCAI